MIKRVFVLIGDRNFRTDVFKVLKNWYKDSVLDLIWMKIDKTQYFNFKTYLRRDRYDAFIVELDDKFEDFEVITSYSRTNGYIPVLLQEQDNKSIEKFFDKSFVVTPQNVLHKLFEKPKKIVKKTEEDEENKKKEDHSKASSMKNEDNNEENFGDIL